jgi:ankyrin repeat protein
MKRLKFALFALCLGAIAGPALSQAGGFDGIHLVDAIKKSDGDNVMQLIHKDGAGIVNAKDVEGNTGLIFAILNRNEDFTAFLLNQGADPNLAGKGGDTPLIAAARSGYEDAVEWLIGQGAKIDAANRMGETPLIIAVQLRQTGMVQTLLAAGANPDKTDNAAGLSARDYAARDSRNRQILQMIEAKKPKASASASR